MLLHFGEAVSRATGAPLLRAQKPHQAGGGLGKLRAAARDRMARRHCHLDGFHFGKNCFKSERQLICGTAKEKRRPNEKQEARSGHELQGNKLVLSRFGTSFSRNLFAFGT